MKQKAIRCPKGPARIYLLDAFLGSFVLISDIFIKDIFQYPEEKPVLIVFKSIFLIATDIFMCRVLYSKRYDNLLIISVATLSLTSIFQLFTGISAPIICDIIFTLLLLGFTYVAVKMTDTPLREKCVKFRFVIPLSLGVAFVLTTISIISELSERIAQTSGSPLDSNTNNAIAVVSVILMVFSSILPLLSCVMLTNWLSDPYEKETNKPKKKDGR